MFDSSSVSFAAHNVSASHAKPLLLDIEVPQLAGSRRDGANLGDDQAEH